MITIPKQLKNKNLFFIKLHKESKKPVNTEWNTDVKKHYSYDEISKWVQQGNNYGIICKNGLIVIDIEGHIENKVLIKKLEKNNFLDSFTVKTGRNGYHIYLKCPDFKRKIGLFDKNIHLGEIIANNLQVVGAGSIHPDTKKTYEVINDKEIKSITYKKLENYIGKYFKEHKEIPKNIQQDTGLDWDISRLINPINKILEQQGGQPLKTIDGIKYRGTHPIHGSTNGYNFEIDINKNVYYCFRCEVGGDAVHLVAMLEDTNNNYKEKCILPGSFKNDPDFPKIKRIGYEKYGFEKVENETMRIRTKEELYLYEKGILDYRLNKHGKPDLDRLPKINYPRLAELILEEHQEKDFILIPNKDKRYTDIFEKKNGIYQNTGEDTLNHLIDKKYLNELSSIQAIKETFNRIRINLTKITNDKKITRDIFNPPPNFIPLNNGVYDLETDKFTPYETVISNKFLTKLPINYNDKAKCPEYDKYLKQTFKTNPKEILTAWELNGYTLYRDYPFKKFFILYGSGDNGKSVFLKVIEKLLSKSNISSESMHDIAKTTFNGAQLYNKFANICGEMKYDDFKDTDKLKKFTGDDIISVQYKYKDPFDIRNFAKIIVNTNSIAITHDTSKAFYGRAFIIMFKEEFTVEKGNRIAKIEKRFTTKEELEGIAFKSIQALRKLLKNGKFHTELSTDENMLQYEGLINYLEDWIKEHVKSKSGVNISQVKLHNQYLKDAKKFGAIPESLIGFGRAMVRLNDTKRGYFGYTQLYNKIEKNWYRENGKPKCRITYIGCEYA